MHVDEFATGRGGGYPVNLNEEEILAAVQKQVEALKQAGLDVTLQRANVTAGGAAHVIAEIAKKQGADLIVAGTRGYGPIAGLILGSVTHRLLHIAHCPILVVPSTPGGTAAAPGK